MKQNYFEHLLTALLLLCTTVASAYDFQAGGIYYNITGATNVEVTYSYSDTYGSNVVIPSSVIYNGKSYTVAAIGESAFYDCSSLESVVIPNSVTNIGRSAFYGCSSLESVVIPNSVTIIENGAFNYCYGLKSMEIPNSVISIEQNAFCGCSSLTSIKIPNSVTLVGFQAFAECYGLTSIVVEDGNKMYDSRGNCNAIIETATGVLILGCENTIIPSGVKRIGYKAFSSCSTLENIEIPDGVTGIGDMAFDGCSALETIEIPNSVTYIGLYAFRGCTNLANITVGNGVADIGKFAFQNTRWYNNQPDGVVYAGKVLYGYKGNMLANTSIKVQEGTLGIAGSAFSGCSGLVDIEIPNSVYCIRENAFYGTTWYNNQPDGVVYAGKVLYKYKGYMPYNNTSIIVEEGTLGIAGGAFNNSSITSVVIPNSVKYIGYEAFNWCRSLKSVTIGNGVTSIGEYAFCGCNSLAGELIIPNSVTVIRDYAFYACNSLVGIQIPESVASIGDFAFCYCTSLARITSMIPSRALFAVNDYVFYDVNKNACTLYVPASTKDAYATTYGWEDFADIVELVPTGVNEVKGVAVKVIYDLQGREVESLTDGIYIVNGKKVLVK